MSRRIVSLLALPAVLGLALGGAAGLPAVAATAAPSLVINEVESDGDTHDWVELYNTSDQPTDGSGLVVTDDKGLERTLTLPAGTVVAGHGFLTVDVDDESVWGDAAFGLGNGDEVHLYWDGTEIDGYAYEAHASTSWGACPDGSDAFVETASATKGAANACGADAATSVVINEVESNAADGGSDWVELYNTAVAAADVSGLVLKDDGEKNTTTVAAGTTIAAGGYLRVDVTGLGGSDTARLFAVDGTTLIDSFAWTAHADETYGRCPDGTGPFTQTEAATPGGANECPTPAGAEDIRINEVESNGDAAGDWVELVNTGSSEVDLGGWVVRDDQDSHTLIIPAGTVIAAGGYASFLTDAGDDGFGLGGADMVRLYASDQTTLIDSYSWSAHAATTYARCPDGTGDFATSAEATRDAANACTGEVSIEAWPGADDVTVIDDADTFADDLSGLFFDEGALWAVNNGTGTLFRLVDSGSTWAPAEEWTLRYPDGTGAVDAEGVTRVGGTVYVASERDNDASGVSRPSVLAYEPDGTGELTATSEWNLAALLPAIGANAGLEGIAWIPDATLVAGGFVDASTGAAYDPARYNGHGDGLFVVGVEGTGLVYAVALLADGQAQLVATIDPGLGTVAEVAYDASSGRLWAVCDDACGGETAVLELASSGVYEVTHHYANPAGMVDTIANEGFALGECVDGERAVYYADDADTDGHSLRQGALDCATDDGSGGSDGGGSDGSGGSDDGSAGSDADGSATAPAESALTAQNRGAITAPASAVAGQTVTLTVGAAYAGQTVYGWLFSTPVSLGAAVVSQAGTVSFVLPGTLPAGAHRLVVTDAAGTVIGWAPVTVRALAATGGGEARGWIPAALGTVALGGILVLVARARRRAA